MKFLENVRRKLHNSGFGDDFLDMIPKARAKQKTDNLDLLKIKNLCVSKALSTQWKDNSQKGKRYLWTTYLGLLPRMQRDLLKLNNKTNNPIKKQTKESDKCVFKEDIK